MSASFSRPSLIALLYFMQAVAPSPLELSVQQQLLPSQAEKYDLEPSAEYAFSGVTTFHHLESAQCLTDQGKSDDVLVVGLPFDTATSFRTGARFGPNAIRQGSRAVSLTYVSLSSSPNLKCFHSKHGFDILRQQRRLQLSARPESFRSRTLHSGLRRFPH